MISSPTLKKSTAAIIDYCKKIGVECKISSHWEKGGKGASDLAEEVVKLLIQIS